MVSPLYSYTPRNDAMAVGLIHMFMNFAAPLATLFALFFFTPPYLILKSLLYIINSIFSEDLAGKVVVIAGASSGIGEHLAYEYARRGACLVLGARRLNSLKEVARDAIILGAPDAIAVRTDVSKVKDCQRLIDAAIDNFGQLNHLVNCAGITPVTMLEEITDITKLKPVTDINFWGYVYTTRFAIPHLRKSNGRIVVIASAASWIPAPRMSLYNASKAAVVGFYETLRIELGSTTGITLVTPGLIESEMTKGKFMSKDGEMVVDQELRDAQVTVLPIESVGKCARAIVNSACHGDNYLTEPFWYRMTFYWIVLLPEIIEWFSHWFLKVQPGTLPWEEPSYKLLNYFGLKKYLYPASLLSPAVKRD